MAVAIILLRPGRLATGSGPRGARKRGSEAHVHGVLTRSGRVA